MTCRQFKVTGRVQGVFFRVSTRDVAVPLKITGHAVNLPDGSVEVLACGEPAAVAEFEQWLHNGYTMDRRWRRLPRSNGLMLIVRSRSDLQSGSRSGVPPRFLSLTSLSVDVDPFGYARSCVFAGRVMEDHVCGGYRDNSQDPSGGIPVVEVNFMVGMGLYASTSFLLMLRFHC